ncbi:lipase family protein [Mycolicibacterium bacteremicum]|uniref:lipase family protein n=1 Tax=Mycolicibacterium bacteremicum TaxID=564198 RepID=UPI0026EB8D13|nr:lipase family protein [Mycolicibacterium bacteremicum]
MTARRASVLVAILMLLLSGCAQQDAPTGPNLRKAHPGQLLATPTDFQGYSALSELSARSVAVRYRSTSGVDDTPTAVSGVVFVPKGQPPPDGWPIAAVGHPHAGIETQCAPSSSPGLMGNMPLIAQLLAMKFVVTMSDYQGLGSPGPHPYLDPATAAYNVIDSVRAARQVSEFTSDAWVGFGLSQGGHAMWAANERAADYGGDLTLAGTISMAAPTDLRPFADAMQAGTLTVQQRTFVPLILAGLKYRHPELNYDDYLHGVMRKRMDVFLECAGDQEGLKATLAESASRGDTRPVDKAATDRLRQWLGEISLPQRPATAPMLVVFGSEDQLVLPQWTRDAIGQACALGDVIDVIEAPGQGHGLVDVGLAPMDWLRGRLSGVPAPNSCAAP